MPGRRIALTGVPGTGKTSVAEAVAAKGLRVIHLQEFARAAGLLVEKDEARDSYVLDMDDLADRFNAIHDAVDEPILLESHFAHEMDADTIVLLRADPLLLVERLRARGWAQAKVRENVEAEALDVLAAEVQETGVPCIEIDATGKTVEGVAAEILAIVETPPEALKGSPVGSAHWRLEALPWF